MRIYDIAVIGAGAAGSMAAIRAGQLKKEVILVERNNSIGKKILITGKGRCNVTNTEDIDGFIERFGRVGRFLRSAFYAFFNEDLMDFLKAKGCDVKVERQGRVFPVTDKAGSVIDALKAYLSENNVKILYDARLTAIKKKDACFELKFEDGEDLEAKKVILATGGASYKATGSSGDGYAIAASFGHTISELKPALVPLRTQDVWVKDLQGVSLENIRITFLFSDKKKIVSEVGDMIFTHFGVSGPLVLDLSGKVISMLGEGEKVQLLIDLKPGLREEQLNSKLVYKLGSKGNVILKNFLKDMLPQKLIPVFLELASISPETKTSQVTQSQRRAMINLFKAFPVTVTGSLAIEEAMVTSGGVSIKDINPRTMESSLVPGLYFAGEIIEGAALSGGYNLQQAFSTGYLAGEMAATCAN